MPERSLFALLHSSQIPFQKNDFVRQMLLTSYKTAAFLQYSLKTQTGETVQKLVSTACICPTNNVSEQLIAKKNKLHSHCFWEVLYLTSSCFQLKYPPVGQLWSHTQNAAREKSRQLLMSCRKPGIPVSSSEETVHSSARAVLIAAHF